MNTNYSHALQQLQMELRAQNLDVIRFSTYRTACKLRFIQKKFNFHLLDLLNVVESLREFTTILPFESGINIFNTARSRPATQRYSSLCNSSQFLSINHLTVFLKSMYTNLNKRLPLPQQIAHIDNCIHSVIAWLLYVYNCTNFTIRFSSFRVVLILLCTGKLVDKMRHLFTFCLCTSSTRAAPNTLKFSQVDDLLHEILALPHALQEISYSAYCKNYAQLIFANSSSPISLNDFLDLLVYNNTTPNCLQWLVSFHRLISVEHVIHRVKCSGCNRPLFSGFRYKCLQCHSRIYQLCQDCFWRGRTSNQHLPTHEMKEYTYFSPSNKDLRSSLRRSLQCLPKPEKHHQYLNSLTIDKEQRLSQHFAGSSNKPKLVNDDSSTLPKIDLDEHKQIAMYVKQLSLVDEKQNLNSSGVQPQTRLSFNRKYPQKRPMNHANAEKKLIISKLEAENRRIVHEINILRTKLKYQSLTHLNFNNEDPYRCTDAFYADEKCYSQTLPNAYSKARQKFSTYAGGYRTDEAKSDGSLEKINRNSYLQHELRLLLARKQELESRIHQLRQSREELSLQLDNLSRILRSSSDLQQRSTSHDHSSVSPSRFNYQTLHSTRNSSRSYSTPSTPIHHRITNHLRTDLLLATDSLTSAMSMLVEQLNTNDSESLLKLLKSTNSHRTYTYDSDNRTDDDSFLTSDDDHF